MLTFMILPEHPHGPHGGRPSLARSYRSDCSITDTGTSGRASDTTALTVPSADGLGICTPLSSGVYSSFDMGSGSSIPQVQQLPHQGQQCTYTSTSITHPALTHSKKPLLTKDCHMQHRIHLSITTTDSPTMPLITITYHMCINMRLPACSIGLNRNIINLPHATNLISVGGVRNHEDREEKSRVYPQDTSIAFHWHFATHLWLSGHGP